MSMTFDSGVIIVYLLLIFPSTFCRPLKCDGLIGYLLRLDSVYIKLVLRAVAIRLYKRVLRTYRYRRYEVSKLKYAPSRIRDCDRIACAIQISVIDIDVQKDRFTAIRF